MNCGCGLCHGNRSVCDAGGVSAVLFCTSDACKGQRRKYENNRKRNENIYTIGIPATLNLALPSIQVSALNAILAPFPGSYILVLGVYYKLQTFIYLTANGIVQGIRPLVGYNYGAGEYDRVKKITHTSMGLIALVMVMGMVISCAIPPAADGIVYHKPHNNGNRRCGTQNHQFLDSWYPRFPLHFPESWRDWEKGMPSLLISLARYIVVMLPVSFLCSAGCYRHWVCGTDLPLPSIS